MQVIKISPFHNDYGLTSYHMGICGTTKIGTWKGYSSSSLTLKSHHMTRLVECLNWSNKLFSWIHFILGCWKELRWSGLPDIACVDKFGISLLNKFGILQYQCKHEQMEGISILLVNVEILHVYSQDDYKI